MIYKDMNEIQTKIQSLSKQIFEQACAYRKQLHRNPELSFQEFETAKFVQSILSELGIEFKPMADTGVVAVLRASHHDPDQPCIALRADLDALPILEENEVEYVSQNPGVMHACGHDVHTSILLGVATVLTTLKEELPHPVKFIFQPGEEKNPGGASLMIEAGVLQNPPVKEMYALHVFPEMETGNLGFKEGIYMASCDEIYMTIKGVGGHGAMPHQCVDPIWIGASIVTNLQQIVSRKCDPKIPSVLSFGFFEGLGETNIIPSTVTLKGTFRTMNEVWRKEAWELIEKQAKLIAESVGGSVEVTISKGYPFLSNDPTVTQKMRSKAITYFGESRVEALPIRLTAEDFAFYSHHVPVCFFRLGVRNASKGIVFGVHHPKFDIDENAILVGIEALSLAVF
jgi:amidohydrolase